MTQRPEDITQADREAVFALHEWTYSTEARRALLAGETDHDPEVQAFARHRLAHTLAGVRQETFQDSVLPWLLECFGAEIANDKTERNHRFLEEALELVQSLGCTRSEAHQLVDYAFDRPPGDSLQESGGVMVTLAALCLANKLDMHTAGETELARIWTKVETIRAKQAAKPKHLPLPAAPHSGVPREATVEIEEAIHIVLKFEALAALDAAPQSEGVGEIAEVVASLTDELADADGAEINPSNYGHDDVCLLNDRYVAVFQVAERAIEALSRHAPVGQREGVIEPSDEMTAALADCQSHRENWRSAIVNMVGQAEVSPPDIDDKAWWEHELHAFDRTFASLAASTGAVGGGEPHLEFRPDEDGNFGEIVARFADGMVHAETMSDKGCYVGFYWNDGRICQWWISSKKPLSYHHEAGDGAALAPKSGEADNPRNGKLT